MNTFTKKYIKRNSIGLSALTVLLGALGLAGCVGDTAKPAATENNRNHNSAHASAPISGEQAKFGVPASVGAEHRELHEQLENAIKSGGKTGEAAKSVEEVLSTHFKNEEEYALPQLGLLPALADGNASSDMARAIELSDKLKAEMPKMLSEHKELVAALDRLADAAKAENKRDAAEFADHLKAHAQNEEEIMYPTAILVGGYLKLKLGAQAK